MGKSPQPSDLKLDLRFHVPLDTKSAILGTHFPASLLAIILRRSGSIMYHRPSRKRHSWRSLRAGRLATAAATAAAAAAASVLL